MHKIQICWGEGLKSTTGYWHTIMTSGTSCRYIMSIYWHTIITMR